MDFDFAMPGGGSGYLSTFAAILLVFYLYLTVRWNNVRRPTWFLIGVLGLLLVMFAAVLSIGRPGEARAAISGILFFIGVVAAFICGIAACYGAELPIHLGQKSATTTQPPPQV